MRIGGMGSQAGQAGSRFDALDSVRGLAALVVVVNHCMNMFPALGGVVPGRLPPAFSRLELILVKSPLFLAMYGRGAVAIFFVLSGFVLALPWFRGSHLPYGLFVLRRFCRIYLPYAAAVAAAMILATWLGSPYPAPFSAWFVGNWIEPVNSQTVLDHVLMLGAHDTFDNAVWSLNHEMRISLVFPLLILPVVRFGLPGAAVTAVVLYATAWTVTHFGGWQGGAGEVAATIRFGTFFIFGGVLARYAERLNQMKPSLLAGASLIAGLGCLWLSREPVFMAIGSSLIILAGILPGGIRRTLQRPWLRWLGRISYSLYLTHLLVLLSAVHLLGDRLPLTAILPGVVAVSLVLATAFQRLVEGPSDQLGRNLARRLAGR